jgi:hypothetical protein
MIVSAEHFRVLNKFFEWKETVFDRLEVDERQRLLDRFTDLYSCLDDWTTATTVKRSKGNS